MKKISLLDYSILNGECQFRSHAMSRLQMCYTCLKTELPLVTLVFCAVSGLKAMRVSCAADEIQSLLTCSVRTLYKLMHIFVKVSLLSCTHTWYRLLFSPDSCYCVCHTPLLALHRGLYFCCMH